MNYAGKIKLILLPSLPVAPSLSGCSESVIGLIQAPGVAAAPQVFRDDATSNPATPPVQIYHMAVWFADPADAVRAGCPGSLTPFDSDNMAGIQVLNTSNFPDAHGPLLDLR